MSQSMSSTRLPVCAIRKARLDEIVLLPSPGSEDTTPRTTPPSPPDRLRSARELDRPDPLGKLREGRARDEGHLAALREKLALLVTAGRRCSNGAASPVLTLGRRPRQGTPAARSSCRLLRMLRFRSSRTERNANA